MRVPAFAALLALAACSGLAYSTTVAQSPATRLAMALSVVPGETTETSFVTRWGYPVQKIRDGGRVDYVYRDIRNFRSPHLPLQGDSDSYVIVTFQYGQAVAVRTSDGVDCRAAFNPRPTEYFFDNPTVTQLAGPCAPGWGAGAGSGGAGAGTRGAGVPDDSYHAGGKGKASAAAQSGPDTDAVAAMGAPF